MRLMVMVKAHVNGHLRKLSSGKAMVVMKAHVKQHTRTMASGKVVSVREHEDARGAKAKPDISHSARIKRAQSLGFDTKNTFYIGSPTDRGDTLKTGMNTQGKKNPSMPGVYLVRHPGAASLYAFTKQEDGDSRAPNITPVYIAAKNTLDLGGEPHMDPAKFYDLLRGAGVKTRKTGSGFTASAGKGYVPRVYEYLDDGGSILAQKIREAGYDSVRFNEPANGETILVFDPEKVRSVNASFTDERSKGHLMKAHVRQHTRTLPSGKVVVVKEHEDGRPSPKPADNSWRGTLAAKRSEAKDALKRLQQKNPAFSEWTGDEDFDDNDTPNAFRAAAAIHEAKRLGWEVTSGDTAGYDDKDASHYFAVRKVVESDPEYGDDYVTAKIRVANHGNTTTLGHDRPDINIAPGENIVSDIEDLLSQKLADEGYGEMSKAIPVPVQTRDHEPTQAQKDAGNYKLKRRRFAGLDVSVETPAGSVRRGTSKCGHSWETRMLYDYGYIRGTLGVDGDHVDCYLGPNEDAPMAYVIHQRRHGDWDKFDEDKCMLGFDSQDDAVAAYLQHYDDPRFLGPVTPMPISEFKEKVMATADKPAMLKGIVVFFKSHVRGHTRRLASGKVVMVRDHSDKRVRKIDAGKDDGQLDMFGGETHTMPKQEAIKEHKRLVAVLNSPSHADDKVEAKKQAKELAEMKGQKSGPTPEEAADPRRKYYVTMIRDGKPKPAFLAGPFDTHDEAKAHVDAARKKAEEVDPRAVWDAFGTSGVVADKHPPGVLNDHLGIGRSESDKDVSESSSSSSSGGDDRAKVVEGFIGNAGPGDSFKDANGEIHHILGNYKTKKDAIHYASMADNLFVTPYMEGMHKNGYVVHSLTTGSRAGAPVFNAHSMKKTGKNSAEMSTGAGRYRATVVKGHSVRVVDTKSGRVSNAYYDDIDLGDKARKYANEMASSLYHESKFSGDDTKAMRKSLRVVSIRRIG